MSTASFAIFLISYFYQKEKNLVIPFCLIILIAFFVVQACYLFSPDPLIYFKGLEQVNKNHNPYYYYYFWGDFYQGRFAGYYAGAFLIKTPVPLLIFLIASIVIFFQKRRKPKLSEVILILPAFFLFIAASLFSDNLGLRYILPVFPFLFTFAGKAMDIISKQKIRTIFVVILMAWYLAGSITRENIIGNNITANRHGAHPYQGNKFYHNNFIDSTDKHVYVDLPGQVNSWDNGYPSGGNYWTNYTGVDEKKGQSQNEAGNDGIGDTPFVIDDNNLDNFPLMAPFREQAQVQPSPDQLWLLIGAVLIIIVVIVIVSILLFRKRLHGQDVKETL